MCIATRERVKQWMEVDGRSSKLVLEVVLQTEDHEFVPLATPDGSTRQRVVSWLLDQHQRDQSAHVPRNVIADLLGMRAETFSRLLHRLDDEGFLEVTRTSIFIIDPDGLRQSV